MTRQHGASGERAHTSSRRFGGAAGPVVDTTKASNRGNENNEIMTGYQGMNVLRQDTLADGDAVWPLALQRAASTGMHAHEPPQMHCLYHTEYHTLSLIHI